MRLVADCGGILSLYLGVSFCIFFELIELLLNIFLYGRTIDVRADRPTDRTEQNRHLSRERGDLDWLKSPQM